MTKETDAKIAELQKEVMDLKRAVVLILASQPIWIGYEEKDRRDLEDWYKKTHAELDISTKGIRD